MRSVMNSKMYNYAQPCEREIIELFYFSEKTAKQISKLKSISETRVFYLKSRVIEKMRMEFSSLIEGKVKEK
nr:hypothetical protein [Ezakiella coagulans]